MFSADCGTKATQRTLSAKFDMNINFNNFDTSIKINNNNVDMSIKHSNDFNNILPNNNSDIKILKNN